MSCITMQVMACNTTYSQYTEPSHNNKLLAFPVTSNCRQSRPASTLHAEYHSVSLTVLEQSTLTV